MKKKKVPLISRVLINATSGVWCSPGLSQERSLKIFFFWKKQLPIWILPAAAIYELMNAPLFSFHNSEMTGRKKMGKKENL